MRGEREIHVVAVESVERDLVEANAFEDLAIRRHEKSVERLHPMDERRGHRADEDPERRDLTVRLADLAECISWPGARPLTVHDLRRTGDPDEIGVGKMLLQRSEPWSRIEKLDVVVRKDDDVA